MTSKASRSHKLDYTQAAALLFKMGVRTSSDFLRLKKEGKRPSYIPSDPSVYYSEYQGWEAFISAGRDYFSNPNSVIDTAPKYQELKFILRRKAISTQTAYISAIKQAILPKGTPRHPDKYYDEFEGWETFLSPSFRFVSYQEAKRFAQQLGLSSSYEWRKYTLEDNRPSYIPSLPDRDYPEFEGWAVFLGVKEDST